MTEFLKILVNFYALERRSTPLCYWKPCLRGLSLKPIIKPNNDKLRTSNKKQNRRFKHGKLGNSESPEWMKVPFYSFLDLFSMSYVNWMVWKFRVVLITHHSGLLTSVMRFEVIPILNLEDFWNDFYKLVMRTHPDDLHIKMNNTNEIRLRAAPSTALF